MAKTAALKRPREPDSTEPLTKRGIKYEGGYGPPPMFTREEHLENLKRQDNKVAAAGLKLLNKTMATKGKGEYELVAANDSATFRTKLGRLYHGNFVARPSDDPNAKEQLFFVECKLAPVDYEPIKCIDLGPVDIAAARCRRSCKLCRLFDPTSPIFHPPAFKIKHLLFEIDY